MQCASNRQRIAVSIDKRQAKTIDIGRIQQRITHYIAILIALNAVRVQGRESGSLNVAGILSNQHIPLIRIEGPCHADIGEEVKVIPLQLTRLVSRVGILQP